MRFGDQAVPAGVADREIAIESSPSIVRFLLGWNWNSSPAGEV
jgi:hypothetical protein